MDRQVETEVTQEHGQWVVWLLVIEEEGIARRRLSVHISEREARVTASSARRGAHRRRRLLPIDDEPFETE